MRAKIIIKKAIEYIALKSAKIACGTASTSNFGQPKEPAMLKTMLRKRK